MTKGPDLRRLVRPELFSVEPYEAVVPVSVLAARLGVPGSCIVKLDANENPYGPSPAVLDAIARVRAHHIYPDSDMAEAREAIGRYLDVPPELVVIGVGSDELVDIIARMFLAPGERMLNLVPTFGMYEWAAGIGGAEVVEVPRREDFTIDVEGIRRALDPRTKLMFVATPNNPTGNAISRAEFRALLDTGIAVVIDEAYAEFAGENYAQFVPEYENLIVLRTMSKWAGLAGLRIGYGVFPRSVVAIARTIRQPYGVNVVSQAALLAALEDRAYLMERVAVLIAERERLTADLAGISFLRPFPSQANFVLCKVVGRDARGVRDELVKRGIFVRYYSSRLLRSYIRVSVGLPEHRERLLTALREMEGETA